MTTCSRKNDQGRAGIKHLFAILVSCALAPTSFAREPDRHPIKQKTATGYRYGYIDHLGHVVIAPRFEDALAFRDRLGAVKIAGKWGSVDETGKLVLPAASSEPLFFSDGLAASKRTRNMCGVFSYVDSAGKTAIPEQPGVDPTPFSNGLATVRSSKKFGYIDKSGKFAIPVQPDWEEWDSFSENLAPVKIKGKWGFINKNGRLVIPALFGPPITYQPSGVCLIGEVYDPLLFSEKLAAVSSGTKSGYIDWSGQFVIKPQFDAALPFSEGLARVKVKDKWGFIDKAGKFVVHPQFELAAAFSEGLAAVQQKSQWGFIDKSGRFVIEPRFESGGEFQSGLAEIQVSRGIRVYIDTQGRTIWDSPYSN